MGVLVMTCRALPLRCSLTAFSISSSAPKEEEQQHTSASREQQLHLGELSSGGW